MADLAELLARAQAGDEGADRELLVLAGGGCIEAQRAIRDNLRADASPECLVKAEVVARMVAARGDVMDWRALACILWSVANGLRARGWDEGAHVYAVEALSMMAQLADEGDGQSNGAIALLAPWFPEAAAEVGLAPVPETSPVPPPLVRRPAPGGARGWLLDRYWAARFRLWQAWWAAADFMARLRSGERAG